MTSFRLGEFTCGGFSWLDFTRSDGGFGWYLLSTTAERAFELNANHRSVKAR
jgi:hypothetical protein